ncbi:GDYXXLXY domain-containing protein [Alkalibacillus aidingensis]|uniref:GDYXXLXY domain-containing protein n=1 Tax=Alkalibacillus aidingensis TaxID=2747607 RepID=UPI0016616349|nr:GDYXXLXY domain-containing protein [Alkalibacillus aidingensis]
MRKKLFFITVILQVLFLLAMVTSSYLLERFGETIKLQTEAYDSQDVFYGDYVELKYLVEEIRPENWFSSDEVKPNQRIYVLLTPNEDGIYQVKAASDMKLEAEGDEVVIQARYQYQDFNEIHHIDLDIGRYNLETGEREEVEASQERLIVSVALSPWGQKKVVDVETVEVEEES